MSVPDDVYEAARREAREVDPKTVARRLNLESHRAAHKYRCPICGPEDGEGDNLHVNSPNTYEPDGKTCAAKCFACGVTCSDTIAMAQTIGDLEHIEALEWLTGRTLHDDSSSPASGQTKTTPSPSPDADGCDDDSPAEAEIEARAHRARETLRVCWERLTRDVVAPLAYLETRGIPEPLAREAGVRPLPGNYWRRLLEDIGPERAVEAGIWNVERSCSHPYSSCIAFAYWHRTEDGSIEFDTLRFREPKPSAPVLSVCSNSSHIPSDIAPTSPRSPYLAPDAVPAARESNDPLYVVEGEIDALSLWRTGRYVVGTPGAHSWQDEWTEQLRGVPRVIGLGDQDGAGADLVRDVRTSIEATFGAGWKRRRFTGRVFDVEGDSNDFLTSFGWQRLDAVLEDLEASLEGNKKAAV